MLHSFKLVHFSSRRGLPHRRWAVSAAVLSALSVTRANASNFTWIGTGSSAFNDANNWSPAQVPSGADVSIFSNNLNGGTVALIGTASVSELSFQNASGSLTLDLGGGTLSATKYTVGAAAGQTNSVTFANGTLNQGATGTFTIGISGSNSNLVTFTGYNTTVLTTSTATNSIGPSGSNNNLLTIANGADLEIHSNISLGGAASTGNQITIANGKLAILGGNRGMTINQGTLTVTNGYADLGLINANAAGNVAFINFNSGTMLSRRTAIANGLPFVIGDGGAITANFGMEYSAPTCNFANGVVLNSNGRLFGSGTITGNVSGMTGAEVTPSSVGQPQVTSDDRNFGTMGVVGNWDNTHLRTNLNLGDFPTQLANTVSGNAFTPPVGRLLINGEFTHGGTVNLDLFDYVPPQDQSYDLLVLGFSSAVGDSSATAVSFLNGSVPLTTQWESDGLHVTAQQVTLPITNWNTNGSGSWSSGSNWDTGSPNGVDSIANFGTIVTSAATVTLDSPQTIGRLNLSGANSYTIGGATLSFDVNNIGTARITVSSGTHTISSPITMLDTAGLSVATLSTLSVTGAISAGSNALYKLGPGLAIVAKINAGTLNVNDGTLQLHANGTASGAAQVAGFSYTGFGKLDLTNNAMIVSYTGDNPSAGIRSAIASGYAGGFWKGNGIMSSLAGGDYSVGYANASDTGASTILGTIPLGPNKVVVRWTLNGDSNLDGVVNAMDFNALANGFGTTDAGWARGDYNYDGIVNALDFTMLADNFGKSLPASSPALGAVVPEPVLGSAFAFAALAAGRTRRRRRTSRRPHKES